MDKNQQKKEPNRNRQSLNAIGRYSGMAFQIAAAVILGVLAGRWLDGKFPMKTPIFTPILTILGVFVGVFLVIKDVLKKN
jgi:F0F1-type ATP synthase assembly protein I